jgi:hypothetical protein
VEHIGAVHALVCVDGAAPPRLSCPSRCSAPGSCTAKKLNVGEPDNAQHVIHAVMIQPCHDHAYTVAEAGGWQGHVHP